MKKFKVSLLSSGGGSRKVIEVEASDRMTAAKVAVNIANAESSAHNQKDSNLAYRPTGIQ